MNTFIFSTILILININLINCDESETDGTAQTPIDVDLKKIKSEDFDIVKSIIEIGSDEENKLESYKLTPKKSKKINKVTFGDVDLWNTKISTECSNITIHSRNCVYFVLKTLENNVPSYIYFRLNKAIIGITGVLSLLYDINYPFLSDKVNKPYPLNISSNFDKIYANHLFKQKGAYRYETFEPNNGETFGIVTDNIDTIWSPTESPLRSIGMAFCKKVRVFKQEIYVRDRNTGRRKPIMVYRFLIILPIDNRTKYLKFDSENDKWVNIDITELRMGIQRFVAKNLYYFDSDESSYSDNESDKNEPYVLDIFKRNEKIKYGISNVYPFRIINLYKSDTTRINEIKYDNQVILKFNFSSFIMNIFNTRNEWYYVEIVAESYVDLTKVKEFDGVFLSKLGNNLYGIYYHIYDRDKDVHNVPRNEFLASLESYISEYGDTDYVKYSNFYELGEGSEESDLSEEIRLKIDPNYTKEKEVPVTDPSTTNDKPDDSKPADSAPSDSSSNPGDAGVPSGDSGSTNDPPPDVPGEKVPPPNVPDPNGPPPGVPGSSPNSESGLTNEGQKPDQTDTGAGEGENNQSGESNKPETGNKKDDEEPEDGKLDAKMSPDSTSSKIKNDVDDKNHEYNETPEKGNAVTVPKESFEVSVVVKPMVRFFQILGLGPGAGKNKNILRVGSKQSGFISSISKISILIIMTSMLI